MKQNIILVAALATLSMVNGVPLQLHKRAVTFVPCTAGSPIPLTVTIDPDPPVAGGAETFTITGTPTSELADGSNFVFTVLDGTGTAQGAPVKAPFCNPEIGVTCPVATGTEFTAKQPVTMPETLPNQIQVELVDAAGTTVGCSVGTVTPADGAPAPDGGDDAPADGGDDAPADGGDDAPADDAPADDAPADDAPADDAPADDAPADDA